jgi:hypothetical protein
MDRSSSRSSRSKSFHPKDVTMDFGLDGFHSHHSHSHPHSTNVVSDDAFAILQGLELDLEDGVYERDDSNNPHTDDDDLISSSSSSEEEHTKKSLSICEISRTNNNNNNNNNNNSNEQRSTNTMSGATPIDFYNISSSMANNFNDDNDDTDQMNDTIEYNLNEETSMMTNTLSVGASRVYQFLNRVVKDKDVGDDMTQKWTKPPGHGSLFPDPMSSINTTTTTTTTSESNATTMAQTTTTTLHSTANTTTTTAMAANTSATTANVVHVPA